MHKFYDANRHDLFSFAGLFTRKVMLKLIRVPIEQKLGLQTNFVNSRHTNEISEVLIVCTCRIAEEFVRISHPHYLTEKWSKNLAKHLIRHSAEFRQDEDSRMIVEHRRRRRTSQRLFFEGFCTPPTKSFAQILYFLIKHFPSFARACRAKTRSSHWFALNL